MPYDITSMWKLKYDINELIYETESQTQRTDLWLSTESEGKGGMDGDLGLADAIIQ